jgi:hypothetical protein
VGLVVRRLALTVSLAILALSVLAGPASAGTRAFLAKPSRIDCLASKLGEVGAVVRCDLPFIGRKAVFLHSRGKARIKQVPGFLHPRRRSTLGRGEEAHCGQFKCTSLAAAVTCRSGNGHGFTVGRKFQLTF